MNTEKQTHAKHLFFQTELSKTQIAEMLGIPRRTLHYWIRQHNWDRQKESAGLMPSLLAENCYHLINRFTQQLLAADTITHKDAEALHKFTITVNKLKNRTTLNENMEIFGCFMDMLGKKAPDTAQAVMPFVDEYIAAQAENSISKFTPPGTPIRDTDLTEQQLDQQDLRSWAEENNQPSAATQPGTVPPGPVMSDVEDASALPLSTPALHSGASSLERHIENLKKMYPHQPDSVFEEFRLYYQENNGIDQQHFDQHRHARTAA